MCIRDSYNILDIRQSVQDGHSSLDGKEVVLAGILTSIRTKATKSNSLMAYLTVEDLYSTINVLVFPQVLQKYSGVLLEDAAVLIRGRVSVREDEDPTLVLDEVVRFLPGTEAVSYTHLCLWDEAKGPGFPASGSGQAQ